MLKLKRGKKENTEWSVFFLETKHVGIIQGPIVSTVLRQRAEENHKIHGLDLINDSTGERETTTYNHSDNTGIRDPGPRTAHQQGGSPSI